jgi:hypothetical protein
MKQFILAVLLSSAAMTAFAQDNTRISIKPAWPADCLLRDYNLLNEVSEVEKIDETETHATFQFVTRLIRCESFVRQPYALRFDLNRVSIGNAVIELASRGETELVVTATFDKTKIFKLNRPVKKQRLEHKTQFLFHPFGYGYTFPQYWGTIPQLHTHPYEGYSFWWNVRVSRDQANVMKMELVRGQKLP